MFCRLESVWSRPFSLGGDLMTPPSRSPISRIVNFYFFVRYNQVFTLKMYSIHVFEYQNSKKTCWLVSKQMHGIMLCISWTVIAHEPMQNISFNVLVCTMYLMECVCTRAYFENKWHWIQLRVHIFSHAYQRMILLIENWLLLTIQKTSLGVLVFQYI